MTDFIGRFLFVCTVNDRPVALSRWRVTTDSQDAAKAVSLLLGGQSKRFVSSGGKGWEVDTSSSNVGVVVEDANENGISFRLAEGYDLGVFFYAAAPWRLSEVLGECTIRLFGFEGSRLCDLSIEPASFTTRNGIVVQYLKPSVVVNTHPGTA
ncbi:hypothetical protein [Streptomyces sp. SID13588]|uniref:hypothetical protein n=1 Tax=Streptomyces sp. SID13588 TaxID=2706051 RepID=UPI0013C64E97|nr:hypothetical protein [Streptomyces sp. SID13588]NEA77213.1 hypothetical protein [Streptomyces sp. SID13588]